MSNPYQSPQPYASGPQSGMPGGGDREQARKVARYQQLVIYALLANLGLNIVSFGAQGAMGGQMGIGFALVILAGALVVAVFSITAMFLLAVLAMMLRQKIRDGKWAVSSGYKQGLARARVNFWVALAVETTKTWLSRKTTPSSR